MKLANKKKYGVVQLTDASVFLRLQIPFVYKSIEGTAVRQLNVWVNDEGQKEYELIDEDMINIIYMGKPIDGYKKISEFFNYHESLGIHMRDEVDAVVDKAFSKQVILQIIKDIQFTS